MGNLNFKHPPKQFAPLHTVKEPLYDPEEMYGIVGTNLMKTFDVREVRTYMKIHCLCTTQRDSNKLNCSLCF